MTKLILIYVASNLINRAAQIKVNLFKRSLVSPVLQAGLPT